MTTEIRKTHYRLTKTRKRLYFVRGRKSPPRQWLWHGKPRRHRLKWVDVNLGIQKRHLERARSHGGKCPLWAVLRETTGLPWLVYLAAVRDKSGHYVGERWEFKTRIDGETFSFVLPKDGVGYGAVMVSGFLDLFWGPRYDEPPAEIFTPSDNIGGVFPGMAVRGRLPVLIREVEAKKGPPLSK